MLREGFEAALIISITLAYLSKTGRNDLSKYVWYGTFTAAALSIALGSLIWITYGSIPKPAKTLFEGAAALMAAAALSYMVYWMAVKGREIKAEIRKGVEAATMRGAVLGLASLSFIAVFREGVESALFLTPFLINEPYATLLGSVLGVFTAFTLAYWIFVIGVKANLRLFFSVTSLLLVLLAGGLVGYGTHEIMEYLESNNVKLGWLAEEAYSIPIAASHPLHHKNIVGSILSVMFGYAVSAEWGRVAAHVAYISMVAPTVLNKLLKDGAAKNQQSAQIGGSQLKPSLDGESSFKSLDGS